MDEEKPPESQQQLHMQEIKLNDMKPLMPTLSYRHQFQCKTLIGYQLNKWKMINKMEFDCKLAHDDQIKRVSGFGSIKELYERISQLFSVPINEVLFCTLNTHNFRDMNALLGNYLSVGDLIVVHLCGKSKELSIKKTQEYLGLTITDNGNGRAFVKKIKYNEDLSGDLIKPGDHIASLNNESTIGMRHYEVAKAIREVPQQTSFTLQLIEPLHSLKYMDGRLDRNPEDKKPEADLKNDRANISLLNFAELNYKNSTHTNTTSTTTTKGSNNPPNNQQVSSEGNNLESLYDDLTNSSLPIDRLLSKGNNAQDIGNVADGSSTSPTQDSYRIKIDKINSILESFLGINDNTLAVQIYRLAKENKDSFSSFVSAIDGSELSVFNFGEDIKSYLWNCALS